MSAVTPETLRAEAQAVLDEADARYVALIGRGLDIDAASAAGKEPAHRLSMVLNSTADALEAQGQ